MWPPNVPLARAATAGGGEGGGRRAKICPRLKNVRNKTVSVGERCGAVRPRLYSVMVCPRCLAAGDDALGAHPTVRLHCNIICLSHHPRKLALMRGQGQRTKPYCILTL